jgi:hypothetical protein
MRDFRPGMVMYQAPPKPVPRRSSSRGGEVVEVTTHGDAERRFVSGYAGLEHDRAYAPDTSSTAPPLTRHGRRVDFLLAEPEPADPIDAEYAVFLEAERAAKREAAREPVVHTLVLCGLVLVTALGLGLHVRHWLPEVPEVVAAVAPPPALNETPADGSSNMIWRSTFDRASGAARANQPPADASRWQTWQVNVPSADAPDFAEREGWAPMDDDRVTVRRSFTTRTDPQHRAPGTYCTLDGNIRRCDTVTP